MTSEHYSTLYKAYKNPVSQHSPFYGTLYDTGSFCKADTLIPLCCILINVTISEITYLHLPYVSYLSSSLRIWFS